MALEASNYLQVFNTAILFVTLFYASYQDLKMRLVDDWLWLTCASITTPITAFLVVISVLDPIQTLASIVITASISVLFYFLGLYGGADAKGLIVISLSAPLTMAGMRYHPFTPITVLLNGLILALSIPAAMSLINIYRLTVRGENLFRDFKKEKAYRKLLALFLGTPISDTKRRRFWASMEEDQDGKRFKFSPGIEDFWRPIRAGGWATPSIPLLVFISGGLVLNYLLGDISAIVIKILTT
ncbi:MAG: prepilin peptidase [Nitrososphaerota archaeon]